MNQIQLANTIVKHCPECVIQKLKLTPFELKIYAYAREFLDEVMNETIKEDDIN